MATAVTATQVYDNTLTNEGAVHIGYVQVGGNGWTWTPTNTSGKTIRLLSVFNTTAGSGTAVKATVSSGVITFNQVTDGDNLTVTYTVT